MKLATLHQQMGLFIRVAVGNFYNYEQEELNNL